MKNRIREARIQAGLRTSDLAKLAGVDYFYLSRIQAGTCRGGRIVRRRLMKALRRSEEDLFGESKRESE